MVLSIKLHFTPTGCIQAVTLEVNEGNSTCIKADLSASFLITYNTTNGTVRTVTTIFSLIFSDGFNMYTFYQSRNPFRFPCEHQPYHLSFIRKRCRSRCLTPPQWTKAAAHVAQAAVHHGWWQSLDPVTHWGWAFPPMEVCTVLLTSHYSTISATHQSSLRPTALVRTLRQTIQHSVQCLLSVVVQYSHFTCKSIHR